MSYRYVANQDMFVWIHGRAASHGDNVASMAWNRHVIQRATERSMA